MRFFRIFLQRLSSWTTSPVRSCADRSRSWRTCLSRILHAPSCDAMHCCHAACFGLSLPAPALAQIFLSVLHLSTLAGHATTPPSGREAACACEAAREEGAASGPVQCSMPRAAAAFQSAAEVARELNMTPFAARKVLLLRDTHLL